MTWVCWGLQLISKEQVLLRLTAVYLSDSIDSIAYDFLTKSNYTGDFPHVHKEILLNISVSYGVE